MADNTTLNSMTGGDTIGADDIGGVKYQRVKLIEGADGTNDGDVSSSNPLPVAQTGAIPAGANSIGTVGLDSGTNTIGKLGANSGVDIGDVDVTSVSGTVTVDATGSGDVPITMDGETVQIMNTSIDGSGSPTIDSYTHASVNLAANTANQSVVSAPGASKQIWVYALMGTVDVDGSISIQDEDDTAISGVMPVSANGGFVMNPSGNFAMPWLKVTTNKALEIDTVTCTFDGVITYAIVSV